MKIYIYIYVYTYTLIHIYVGSIPPPQVRCAINVLNFERDMGKAGKSTHNVSSCEEHILINIQQAYINCILIYYRLITGFCLEMKVNFVRKRKQC
jgi:hypothetical protein